MAADALALGSSHGALAEIDNSPISATASIAIYLPSCDRTSDFDITSQAEPAVTAKPELHRLMES